MIKTINFISLFNQHPLTEIIVDCWAKDLSYNDFKDLLSSREDLKCYNCSKEVFNLIFKLLDEQQKSDIDLHCSNKGDCQ